MQQDDDADLAAVGAIAAVPKILDALSRLTGMRFAAVARVTESRWVACAVRDDIDFGLAPGGELDLSTTLCDEVRGQRQPIAFTDALADDRYRDHHTPRIYGLRGYLSVPIIRADGSFFGTLCAIDPEPAGFPLEGTIATAQLFADLLGMHLDAQQQANQSRAALESALQTAQVRQHRIVEITDLVNNALQSLTFNAYNLRQLPQLPEQARDHARSIEGEVFSIASAIQSLADGGGRVGRTAATATIAPSALAWALQLAVATAAASDPGRNLPVSIAITREVDCDLVPLCEACTTLVRMALTGGRPDRPVEVDAHAGDDGFTFAVSFVPQPGATLPRSPFAAEHVAREHHGELQRIESDAGTRLAISFPCTR